MMKKCLLILCCCIAYINYAQENVQKNTITGIITNEKAPVPNVVISSTVNNTTSNAQGAYTIEAIVGSTISFTHSYYEPVEIIVEDVTRKLNIELEPKFNELGEVVISENTNQESAILKKAREKHRKIITAYGTIDPESSGFEINHVSGNGIDNRYPNIANALLGKVPGLRITPQGEILLRDTGFLRANKTAIFDVDGMIYTTTPPINLDEIEDVYVIKSLAGLARYGQLGSGGVIIIKTNRFQQNELKQIIEADKYFNKKNYDGNAVSFVEQESLKISEENFDLNNPEDLKAKAYLLQENQRYNEAIEVYKKVFKLRPRYAQSYRDLANAYVDIGWYDKSWRLYMGKMLNSTNFIDEGIGQQMYNEAEWHYHLRNKASRILQKFVPNNKKKEDFENDVRIVVEWNTSEAEFDLEFVNPDKQAYVFEHTLKKNKKLIEDEKIRGYNSKEFYIPEISEKNWLMNLTYYGNKKNKPSYFKVTTYYNWGRPSQQQQIKVFKLNQEQTKFNIAEYSAQKSDQLTNF